MKKVGILYHPKIPAALTLARDLAETLGPLDVCPWLHSAWEEQAVREEVPGSELVLSIGGDGTILRAARLVVPWPIPIVGINLGKLGFMTELSPKDALIRVPAFLGSEGWIDERAMLCAELLSCGSDSSTSFEALNDVVIGRGAVSRVIHVDTVVDGGLLTTYKADGVIVATATGSTGYSLASGGPILYPQAKELVLQPVSSHLGLATALVLSPDVKLEFKVQTDHQAVLSIDGQVEVALQSGDRIKVSRSPHVTRFLRAQPPGFFYRTLMQRLSSR